MAPIIGRRSSSLLPLLLVLCCVAQTAKLRVRTRAYMAGVTSVHGGEGTAKAEAHTTDVVTDFSVGIKRAFGDNETAMNSDAPPPEETWLIPSSPSAPKNNSSSSRVDDDLIPRTIYKIYFQKDGTFGGGRSHLLREAHESWTNLNPGYDVEYYNLNSARSYLEAHFHPVFLRTFDCIQAFAGKSDFFRMALLYREGGFYSDWKQVCLKPDLLNVIANETDFFTALDIGNGFTKKTRSCVANAFVGATPRHPISARYLEHAMNNVKTSMYPVNALFLTGPCLLGMAVLQVEKDFGGIESEDGESTPTHENFHSYTTGKRVLSSYFSWRGERVILGKCEGCGQGQDWRMGNNYNKLYDERRYYCEDSASIFKTSFGT